MKTRTLAELCRETASVTEQEPGAILETVETFFCLLINSLGDGQAVRVPLLGTLRPYGEDEPRAPGAGPIEFRVSTALEAAMNYAKASACASAWPGREETISLPRQAEILPLPMRTGEPAARGGRHAD